MLSCFVLYPSVIRQGQRGVQGPHFAVAIVAVTKRGLQARNYGVQQIQEEEAELNPCRIFCRPLSHLFPVDRLLLCFHVMAVSFCNGSTRFHQEGLT
jgi:hypothetical protein